MAVFADAARAGRSICFTFAPEATVRPGFPERVRGLVEANGDRGGYLQPLRAHPKPGLAALWRMHSSAAGRVERCLPARGVLTKAGGAVVAGSAASSLRQLVDWSGFVELPWGPMMYDEIVMAVRDDRAQIVESVSLATAGLRERDHLQEWVLAHPEILGEGVEIVASEYDRWQTQAGAKVADRLDVLGIDAEGRLVVAELKRDAAPHTIHMQAINYAAMVSRLTVRDIAGMYARTRSQAGAAVDVDAAEAELESQKLLTGASIKSPRIVLIASQFPASVTASVVWLNEQGVDISLIQFRSYRLAGGEIIVSFSRLYPVPDVEDFTIGPRRAAADDVDADRTPVSGPGDPWDAAALERLAGQGNTATLTMIDLAAAEEADAVTVSDICRQAGLTPGQVKGQLAGLTMRLRNPQYGFSQTRWPVEIVWLPTGQSTYRMEPALAQQWRAIRRDHGPEQSAIALNPDPVDPRET